MTIRSIIRRALGHQSVVDRINAYTTGANGWPAIERRKHERRARDRRLADRRSMRASAA